MTITNSQKVEMVILFNENEYTLTEIGEQYGVSRKTVRRRIDEVEDFYKRIEKGDQFKLEDGDIFTVVSKDSKIKDDMPVFGRYSYSMDGIYIELHHLMDAELIDSSEKPVEEKQEEEADNGLIPVGTTVRIRKDSEHYGREFDGSTLYGNPKDVDGEVVYNEKNEGPGYIYEVRWNTGTKNNYRHKDLEVVEAAVEVAVDIEIVDENALYYVTAPQDSITIIRIDQETGEVSQKQTNKHAVGFSDLRRRISDDQSQKTLREVYLEMDTKRMLETYSVGRIRVDVESESVVFVKPDGSERNVPEDIAGDIIDSVSQYGKESGDKLVKFLDMLMDNPSFRSIEGLYRFMKHNCIEINDDGMITAWKGVRSDLHSCHSGKIKSSPTVEVRGDGRIYNGNFGTEIRVDRSEVNDNPDQTCSHGLHVGNHSYASSFGEKTLKVSVNPADVVAVPYDYEGAKVRCCAYTPIEAI